MSYARNHRRKIINQFKRKYKDKWAEEYRKHVDHIKAIRLGPLMGTLEDIMILKKTSKQ